MPSQIGSGIYTTWNMLNNGMMSSKTDLWETPQWLFDQLNKEFNFTLDCCAIYENRKCNNYFSPAKDGLTERWEGHIWMNPPYGRQIGKWIKKAFESKVLVVGLLPARTDTKWFWNYIYNKAEIRFLKGRLKFGGSKNSAPFPSMVVIWRPR